MKTPWDVRRIIRAAGLSVLYVRMPAGMTGHLVHAPGGLYISDERHVVLSTQADEDLRMPPLSGDTWLYFEPPPTGTFVLLPWGEGSAFELAMLFFAYVLEQSWTEGSEQEKAAVASHLAREVLMPE